MHHHHFFFGDQYIIINYAWGGPHRQYGVTGLYGHMIRPAWALPTSTIAKQDDDTMGGGGSKNIDEMVNEELMETHCKER